MHSPSGSFCLSQFTFTGSIDFVTIATPGKRNLPPLLGRPEWGVSAHHRQLTIHDLQPADIPALVQVFGPAHVLELEVTVDGRPDRHLGLAIRNQKLTEGFAFVARHLHPYEAPGMKDAKTAGYVPELRKLMPFNRRVPASHEQLLFGFRNDGPVQVKVYRKGRDNGSNLAVSAHSVRMEVRLKRQMCEAFGIKVLEDLLGLPYRRLFSPYFRMVSKPVARKGRSERSVLALVHERHAMVRQVEAERAWSRTGVQGAREVPEVRYRRHPRLNQRIGGALHRLQERFSRKNLVRVKLIEELQPPELAALFDGCMRGRVTIKNRPLTIPRLLGIRTAPRIMIST